MAKKYRLILVDDEPWALLGLEEIIDWETEGFEVVARCGSGEEALQQAILLKPDAMVTDIRMPGMSGLDLIKILREKMPHLKSIIVSAYSDFIAAKEAIRLSASYYIVKPLLEEEVLDAVRIVKEQIEIDGKSAEEETQLLWINEDDIMFPKLQVRGNGCWLLLVDSIEILDSLKNTVDSFESIDKGTEEPEKESNGFPEREERRTGCRQKVQIGNYYGLLVDWLPSDLPSNVGVSIMMPDFKDADLMFRTARASLEGGFLFAQAEPHGKKQLNAADIQLWLYEHLGEEVTLKALAGQFFLNETYLCDLFKKQEGGTIFAFLRRIRMHYAIRLLADSRMALQEVAERCGYKDYSHFGQHFKREVGMSPDLYRRKKSN